MPLSVDRRRALALLGSSLAAPMLMPRMGRAAEAPPRIASEHESLLTQLVECEIGKLSLRDRLPYTDAFDRIVTTFNTQAGLNLSPHDVWRIIAKLAK